MSAETPEALPLAALTRIIGELQQYLQALNRLLPVETGGGESGRTQPDPRLQAKAREEILKAAIMEAIDELEESRKAFKSKRLEQLRKKLTYVLLESK
ncbi:MAG: hypothetical protein KKB20_28345 [Proteobacteria bacterium]|nr:hypothetical protein [Pseudomonadota bacterium]